MGKGKTGGDPLQQTLATGRRWSFGNVVLDERSLELRINGSKVKLEPRPLEVLIYLLNHAGDIVTKDELQEALWPGRILSESVLTRTISVLRQALGDGEHDVIETVHGFGYRLIADLKVEAPSGPASAKFCFEPGTSPPLRPNWKLVERLGTGGLGEAWLAQHQKNQDTRVFKFALNGAALASFKREITLYRVIRSSLGARAAVAQILDWNLEQQPHFLEVEYLDGRDLEAWAESQGGLLNIPLGQRLELVAQVAEALAATHSVGVLHKDLKPGNVLIQLASDTTAAPRAKLCDFGSGGVLDPERLEQLGITRVGLTATDAKPGTLLYAAPEVLGGQPGTLQADIYALGVILYQAVVGSFHKPLAPGWEHDIDDELLREDIALAAAGAPERRLKDAAALAERLRTLQSRRDRRRAERAERERAERTKETMHKLRRARAAIVALVLLSMAAIAGGVVAYRARNEAMSATATTQAINAFLTDDVLGIDPSIERPSDASYESLLARATAQVDKRFAEQPEAAANLHLTLGRRYQEIGKFEEALPHFERAVRLFTELDGASSDAALLALEHLGHVYFGHGRTADALQVLSKATANCATAHGPLDPATLLLRVRVARLQMLAGQLTVAESELRSVLNSIPRLEPPDPSTALLFKEWFGVALANDISALRDESALGALLEAQAQGTLAVYLREFAGEYAEAEDLNRQSIATYVRLLGDGGELVAENRLNLSQTLATLQKFDEAETLIRLSNAFYDKWLSPHHWLRAAQVEYLAELRLEQGRIEDGLALLSQVDDFCRSYACSPMVIGQGELLLALTLERAGRNAEAERTFRRSAKLFDAVLGKSNIYPIRSRIGLAGAQSLSGLLDAATATLAEINEHDLATLPRPKHLVLGEYRRAQGLLSLKKRDARSALSALTEALEIFELRLGHTHWKTERARNELEQARAQLEKT